MVGREVGQAVAHLRLWFTHPQENILTTFKKIPGAHLLLQDGRRGSDNRRGRSNRKNWLMSIESLGLETTAGRRNVRLSMGTTASRSSSWRSLIYFGIVSMRQSGIAGNLSVWGGRPSPSRRGCEEDFSLLQQGLAPGARQIRKLTAEPMSAALSG